MAQHPTPLRQQERPIHVPKLTLTDRDDGSAVVECECGVRWTLDGDTEGAAVRAVLTHRCRQPLSGSLRAQGEAAAPVAHPEPRSASSAARCGCGELFRGLSDEHHDWLTSIEERGAEGFAELVEWAGTSVALHQEPGELPALELRTFVAAHNWRQPAAMYRLASELVFLVDQLVRPR